MTDVPTERVMEILALAEKAGGREWFTDPKPTVAGLAIVDDGASMWPIKAEWPQGQFIAAANPEAVTALLTELLALRAAATEVIAQNRDYLTHLNNGAQTDPLTRAIEALARALQSHSTGDDT